MPDTRTLRRLAAAQIVSEQQRGALLVDIRSAEQFASLYLRGAVQIGLAGSFASWAAILIRPEQRLVLVADLDRDAHEARTRLSRVGLDQVTGYVIADPIEWRKEGLNLDRISVHRVATAATMLQHAVRLIDVRSRAEWLKGHLPGAISVPLLDLHSHARLLDASAPSLVYCNEGYRATTAASILRQQGAADVGILIDGVEGWSAAGLALEL